MKRFLCSIIVLFVASTLFAAPLRISGVVRDDSGRPVSGVKVTDGFNIVRTDNLGRYELYAHDAANFVYLSIPSGFKTNSRNGAPLFYKSVDRRKSLQKVDFDIIRTNEDETHHQFFVMADVQVYKESEFDLVRKAVADAKSVSDADGLPSFGVSCGDLVGEWNSGFMVDLQKLLSEADFPFFALMGNHDFQYGAATNEESKLIYTDLFGPTYYSFDKGGVHYVVLDDVFYYYRHYIGYLEQSQLEWLKKDLAGLEKGSTLVLFMHIPTYSREARSGQWNKEEYNKIVTNRKALYSIVSDFDVHICSAHEHYAENYIIEDNIFEHVHAPLSGLFWQSLYSCDGVPWGYYVYDVKDGKIDDWYYKPVGKSRQTQFSADRVGADPMKPHSVVANVWNYDPAWKVEWRENGVDQGAMTQYSGWDRTIVDDVDARRDKEFTWKYIGAGQTEHLFYATPSSIDADVEIIVTDRFGHVYTWNSSPERYEVPAQSPVHADYGVFHGLDKTETELYNRAIDEMVQNKEEDGTFRTGELWGGVWTRDLSYSAILGLAHLEPEIVKTSLMRKVDAKGRIIQDTGTGGAWPCSTDREIWAVAAYEVFLETGDMSWLRQVYPIIKRSLEADMVSVYNPKTGLFRGESSFIDWREQSYPAWMQPADIAASECLGTNAVFYRAFQVMSFMASCLGPSRASDVKYYSEVAVSLKNAINRNLWQDKEGWYAQYIYGRGARYVSGRSETLGESLCILWGIASQQQAIRIVSNMPVSKFGPTIFSPQISSVGPYHNDAVWPFVTSFYGMAAAKTGNSAAVELALDSNMRVSLQFGSNMENIVASDGSINTALNSRRQLWSVAGYSGLIRNVLLGINYEAEGIRFSPVVPASMKGCRKIENFKYRNMTLDVEVIGEGKIMKSCQLDGKDLPYAFIPASLTGHHSVVIMLTSDYYAPKDTIKIGPVEWDLNCPKAVLSGNTLSWESVAGADSYRVFRNGSIVHETEGLNCTLSAPGEYCVMATSESGKYSFVSEPRSYLPKRIIVKYDVLLDNKLGQQAKCEFDIPKSGRYLLSFLYSNGNGDITTFNKCATRTVFVDKEQKGAVVMPQRGDSWEDRGFTQPMEVYLEAGSHVLVIKYLEDNINMNVGVDSARIHAIWLTYEED